MNLTGLAVRTAERAPIPDVVARLGVDYFVERACRRLEAQASGDLTFVREMAGNRIALSTEAANRQHYELPACFFGLILGPHRKYSSCLYATGESLAQAEARALAETCEHADLHDSQQVLELGCGWGSLSLWMAERYPNSRIVAVSNSTSQRQFIETEAAVRKLGNLRVITADMNDFSSGERFDRIVSVEMFEHMSNWQALLARVRQWLKPDGRLFLHFFSHRSRPYRFDIDDRADWIAQHFFTGGVMPSHGLVRNFADLFRVEHEWRWSGKHYERTAMDWLANYNRHSGPLAHILQEVYGEDWRLWQRRWRLFFLATAGLFGARRGQAWGVSHYRLAPSL